MTRHHRRERGQTSLFMALFIFTMITMFAFTTNIGMLVHAKINLQNAADSAAYAGAAVQARQLTAVGYLNWEMRRALKEFLFYYTVRGEYASLPCFPRDTSGSLPTGSCPTNGAIPMCPQDGMQRYNFAFYDCREKTANETGGPYLPSVCIIFDQSNNYCQKAGVPGIPQFQGGGSWGVADPIVSAVQSATNQIIEKKVNDCLGRTDINRQFLIAWLFNLNPVQGSDALLTIGNDSDDPFPFSDGLARVGVLPRMAILRSRIDNFEEELNLNLANEGIGAVTMTDNTITAMQNVASGGNKNLDYFERPIQAFLSAKNNLPGVGGDNGIFADVELTELLPNQPGAPTTGAGFDNPFVKNPPILVKFKDEFARMTVADSRFETRDVAGVDKGNCFQVREERVIPHFPFGISKYPGLLTYYAVRLQAKARLLFSPFGTNGLVTLSAYSAAKPFGSRIGKDLSYNQDTELHQMVAYGLQNQGDLLTAGFTPTFPNVLVSNEDSDTQVGGFTAKAHLGYLYGAMFSIGGGGRLDYGPRIAGAYAPWEVGYYTVPAQYNTPEQIGLFEDNPKYDGQFFYLIAPILPVNGGSDLAFLRTRVGLYMVGDIADAVHNAQQVVNDKYGDFLGAVQSDFRWGQLFGYLAGQGEVTKAAIPDPLLSDNADLRRYAQNVGQRFSVTGMPNAQRRQLTSWNNQKTAQDQDIAPPGNIPANSELGPDIGRSGYSVRFVSFKSLQAGGQGTNDPIMPDMHWSNPFERMDSGGGTGARIQDDLSKIRH